MEKIKINGRTRLKVYENGSVNLVIHKTDNFEEIEEKIDEESKPIAPNDEDEFLMLDVDIGHAMFFTKANDENEGGQK